MALYPSVQIRVLSLSKYPWQNKNPPGEPEGLKV